MLNHVETFSASIIIIIIIIIVLVIIITGPSVARRFIIGLVWPLMPEHFFLP